jgi:Uma2 family endonuclease
VRSQSPITIPPENEPEPDVAIVTGVPDDYSTQHPGPTEIVAVMEVADSSLRRDRVTKLQVYANAGIPTYWIVNLLTDQIEVYTSPQVGHGQYAGTDIYSVTDIIPLALGNGRTVSVSVADVLP